MTKHVTAIFVAIMLLTQIGIAQHNVVHFTDHGHYEQNGDDSDHKKSVSESCQICLLTKSLSFGLITHHADLPTPVLSSYAVLNGHDPIVSHHQYALYNPRAPPSFLI